MSELISVCDIKWNKKAGRRDGQDSGHELRRAFGLISPPPLESGL